jgi:hypothetical protein
VDGWLVGENSNAKRPPKLGHNFKSMCHKKRLWSAYALLLLVALGFRLFVALRLPNDEPDDGRVYSQIARNVLEQHVYSHDTQAPYVPSIIRLPGYPLFLAAVYGIFGHGNNTAVRVVQAVIDTLTCVVIALIAFEWAVAEERKHRAAIVAFALAAACPFTAIYVATILTEVWASFLAVAMVLTATFAFKAATRKRALAWWVVTGLIAGLAVLFRPDSGLFAAAIGGTLVVSAILTLSRQAGKANFFAAFAPLRETAFAAVLFSFAFCLVLVPWTIRNRRVFHVFQPLSPTHGEMPGEFVPRGYLLWLRTWLDDSRYVGPVLWSVDTRPIRITDFPERAFDSKEERDRVAALLEKYNHPPDEEAANETPSEDSPQSDDQSSDESKDDESKDEDDQDEEEPEEEEQQQEPEEANVEMTPEIDAGFSQIGQERVAHSRLRYYVVLPLKRAMTLWFDTHSQYYPFNGELLPLKDLDYDIHQQYWLPLFAGLTWLYSLLGVIGGWLLWRSRGRNARKWLLLAALLVFLRLGFFATLENPEPRYTVEIFPFLTILAGAGASILKVWATLFRSWNDRRIWSVGRRVQVDGLPRRTESLEHERHATGSSFRSAFVSLRLSPLASNDSAISAEHRYRDVADVKLHVFNFRIRSLAVLPHLVPAPGDGAIVIEEIQTRRVPVTAHHLVDIRVLDSIEQAVEGSEYCFRAGRLLCCCSRLLWRRRGFLRLGSRRLRPVCICGALALSRRRRIGILSNNNAAR